CELSSELSQFQGTVFNEELPDYIMVMVANKKSQEQMTEDLSLFLGNNTVRFTVWYVCKLIVTLLISKFLPISET
uniref:Zinc finger CCCH domain-containing protein 14 n=1 Tax=Pavo cristatus TaxID=9049 RepID=A0A8C9FYJ4_PAVCR